MTACGEVTPPVTDAIVILDLLCHPIEQPGYQYLYIYQNQLEAKMHLFELEVNIKIREYGTVCSCWKYWSKKK